MGNLTRMLACGNFIVVNKALVQMIGLKPAVMLAELCNISGYKHAEEHNNEFTATIEEIKMATGLSRAEQETAIKNLIDYEIIIKDVKGTPATRWFRIREDMISDYLYFGEHKRENDKKQYVENRQTRKLKTDKLERKIFAK